MPNTIQRVVAALCLFWLTGCTINVYVSPTATPVPSEAAPPAATTAAPTRAAVAATPALTLPPQSSAAPAATGQGTTFYVAGNEPGASDSNNGLFPTSKSGKDGPWQTIRQAARTMNPGDTTYIRAGIYYEASIRFARSGTQELPIRLVGQPGEQAVLDGSRAGTDASGIELSDGRSHIVIEGLTIRKMPRNGITALGDNGKAHVNLTVRNCLLHDNGLSGLRLVAVNGFGVENVEAHSNGYYGADITASEDGKLSATNGVVKDSRFYNHTGKQGHGLGINQGHHITVSDSVAYHNTIHGFDASDMPKGGEVSHDLVFERNISYENGVSGFSINSGSHHVTYRNNAAWGNGADWAKQGSGNGFLCYEGCWHVEYYHNVSVGNTDAGFRVQNDASAQTNLGDRILIYKNNVAFNNGRPQWEDRAALVVEGAQWVVQAEPNNWGGAAGLNARVVGVNLAGNKGQIYRTDDINRGLFGVGNRSLDPQFVNAGSADFRLRPGSPMIDAGVDVGVTFCGSAPDFGAIETCSN